MNVLELKERLSNDTDKIILLLEKSGFNNVHVVNAKYIRCGYEDGFDSVSVNIETLSSVCYSKNINGDIFTLIQNKLNMDFYDTFKYCCSSLGYSSNYSQKRILRTPFNGVWRKFSKAETYDNDDYDTYTDEELLGNKKISGNHLFLKDGISLPVQEEFLCHYDIESNRFGIVWKDQFGRNIGCMGRYNGDYEADKVSKWHPIGKGFNKSNHLFGLNYNRDKIIEKDAIFIGESEKFVLQLASWDIRTGVGLGGNQLSQTRINLIHGLRVKRIFICLDEGLEESHSKKLAELLKCNTSFYSNEVRYIFDKDNKYLPKDSKMSPSDLDYEDFKNLIKECSILV